MKPPSPFAGGQRLPATVVSHESTPAPAVSRDDSNPSKKMANGLVALSSAVVLAVYTAGYLRTRPAADRFDEVSARRRLPVAVTAHAMTQAPAKSVAAGAPLAQKQATPSPVRTGAAAPNDAKNTIAGPTTSSSTKSGVPALKNTVAAKTKEADKAGQAAASTSAAATPSTAQASTVPATATATTSSDASTVMEGQTAEPPAAPPQPVYKDGTYSAWGTCRHGDVEVTVGVEGGHIVSAAITACYTRYSCSWISHLPAQVISRQSPQVDYVSGATQSGNAFYYAVYEALTKAK